MSLQEGRDRLHIYLLFIPVFGVSLKSLIFKIINIKIYSNFVSLSFIKNTKHIIGDNLKKNNYRG
jgi:hypothetical protein